VVAGDGDRSGKLELIGLQNNSRDMLGTGGMFSDNSVLAIGSRFFLKA